MEQDNEINADVSPVYILRKFAWDAIKANLPDLTEEDYGGIIPIVPLSEEPELSDTTKPYIVYGYANDATRALYAEKHASMTFVIYDQNFRRLTRILNVLEATFERQDETASELNKYSTNAGLSYVGCRFGTVGIGFTEGGTPETEEGGRQSALLNIRFTYFINYDVKRYVVTGPGTGYFQ